MHASTHAQVGRIVGNLFDFFNLGLEFFARKLKQVVGLRQAVVGVCVFRHVQADDALERTAQDRNGVTHEQTNLRRRDLDHGTVVAKAVKVNMGAICAAFGRLHAELAKVTPRAAHVAQVGGHAKLHQVFAHAAVHEQRATLWVQIQDAHRDHVDGFDGRERGNVFLTVADIHQKRRDGAK